MRRELAPCAPYVGERVGHFRVRAKIGGGAASEVYLAEHEAIHTRAAIKILHPHLSTKPDHVRRFFNEAIAASEIPHAGVVKIFDAGSLPCGRAFLVMEYLDGETLTRRIRRAGRLPLVELAQIARQIASALGATHAAGITHRDLKPDNVFLVRDAELACGMRAKLLDFGIAKLAGVHVTGTSVGAMGTPDYMAPEQWEDVRNVDWRADAYALGCVVFEMATGRVPFPASNIAASYAKHRNEEPPDVRTVAPELPAELDRAVSRLMAKDPGRRPDSMSEVAATFAALADEPGVAPIAVPAMQRDRATVATATRALLPDAPPPLAGSDQRAAANRIPPLALLVSLGSIALALLGILITLVVAVAER